MLIGENIKLHIWDPVSIWNVYVSVCVEKNRMCLSAVPPPEAKIGKFELKDNALTAALCSEKVAILFIIFNENKTSLLSLPPEAIIWESGDHLIPQISCWWAL